MILRYWDHRRFTGYLVQRSYDRTRKLCKSLYVLCSYCYLDILAEYPILCEMSSDLQQPERAMWPHGVKLLVISGIITDNIKFYFILSVILLPDHDHLFHKIFVSITVWTPTTVESGR